MKRRPWGHYLIQTLNEWLRAAENLQTCSTNCCSRSSCSRSIPFLRSCFSTARTSPEGSSEVLSSLENNIYSIWGTVMSIVHTEISVPLTSVRYERLHEQSDADRCGLQQQRACHHCCQRQEPREPHCARRWVNCVSVASVLFAAHQKGESKSGHWTYMHTELRVCLLLAPKNTFKNKTWTTFMSIE